jgi:hypothetical protein
MPRSCRVRLLQAQSLLPPDQLKGSVEGQRGAEFCMTQADQDEDQEREDH